MEKAKRGPDTNGQGSQRATLGKEHLPTSASVRLDFHISALKMVDLHIVGTIDRPKLNRQMSI